VSEHSRNSLRNRDEFREGIEHFDSKRFWHAHESWETIWLASGGDEKIFLQGLIQLTAAYHLVTRARFSGALRLFRSSSTKLSATQNFGSEIIDVPFIVGLAEEMIDFLEDPLHSVIPGSIPQAPGLESLLARTEFSVAKSSSGSSSEIL